MGGCIRAVLNPEIKVVFSLFIRHFISEIKFKQLFAPFPCKYIFIISRITSEKCRIWLILAISFSVCFPPQESDSGARDAAAAYGTGGVGVGHGPGWRRKSDSNLIPGSAGGAVASVSLRWGNAKLVFCLNVPCAVRDLAFVPSGEFDSLRLSPRPGEDRSPSSRSPSPFQPLRSPSPLEISPDTASISSCPEMVGHMVGEKEKKWNHE